MQSRNQSSIGEELKWLALWLVIFVAITAAMLKFIVPHHFNDRVAIMISAILSGVIMIVLRGRASGRLQRR